MAQAHRNVVLAELLNRIHLDDDPFFRSEANQKKIIEGLQDAGQLNRRLQDAREIDHDLLMRQISV